MERAKRGWDPITHASLRVALGILGPAPLAAALMTGFDRLTVAEHAVPPESGAFLELALAGYVVGGVQSAFYSFVMEGVIQPARSSLLVVLSSAVLGALAGWSCSWPVGLSLDAVALWMVGFGAVVGLILGVVLRLYYVSSNPSRSHP